ncbi:MAG: hypothetical protein KDA21_06615 [Phycisphaerales bacterium]|nr:hypothetical protein [Phycisphaerales bacterium]
MNTLRHVLTLTLLSVALFTAACASSSSSSSDDALIAGSSEPPVPSLLGRPLSPLRFDAATLRQYEADLATARVAYERDPTDEMNAIWYGRRLAYLGRYREAIEVFTRGLALHPDSYRLLRHRGHRYITLRRLDLAEQDLARAAALIEGVPDAIEPDGQPNPSNLPRSTTNSNIWYHYALTLYLQGRFDDAAAAWTRCLDFARINDDMLCATLYWLWHARMHAGRSAGIRPWLRDQVRPGMDIIENHTYHRLLLFYAGEIEERDVIDISAATPVELATHGYGIADWYLVNGHREEATQLMQRILQTPYWPAFGYLAAEAELARLRRQP